MSRAACTDSHILTKMRILTQLTNQDLPHLTFYELLAANWQAVLYRRQTYLRNNH